MPKKIEEHDWWFEPGTLNEPYNYLPVGMDFDYETGKINVTSNLSITTSSLPFATAYADYSTQLKLNKSGNYHWEAEGLPLDLEIDYETGKISGRPAELISKSTTYPVTIKVYNESGYLRAEKQFNLYVNVTGGITGTLSDADIHVDYSSKLTLNNASGISDLAAYADGLPDGIEAHLRDNGVLEFDGSPTVEYAEDKTYTVDVVFYHYEGGRTIAYKQYELKVLGMYPHLKGGGTSIKLVVPAAELNAVSVNSYNIIHGSLASVGVNSFSVIDLRDGSGNSNSIGDTSGKEILSVNFDYSSTPDKFTITLKRVYMKSMNANLINFATQGSTLTLGTNLGNTVFDVSFATP